RGRRRPSAPPRLALGVFGRRTAVVGMMAREVGQRLDAERAVPPTRLLRHLEAMLFVALRPRWSAVGLRDIHRGRRLLRLLRHRDVARLALRHLAQRIRRGVREHPAKLDKRLLESLLALGVGEY